MGELKSLVLSLSLSLSLSPHMRNVVADSLISSSIHRWPRGNITLSHYAFHRSPVKLDFSGTYHAFPQMNGREAGNLISLFSALYMHVINDLDPALPIHKGFSRREAPSSVGMGARATFAFLGPANERVGLPRDLAVAVLSYVYGLGKEFQRGIDFFQVGSVTVTTDYQQLGRVSWGVY